MIDWRSVREVIAVGWCKQSYRTSDGRHCLIGAIAEVVSPDAFYNWITVNEFKFAPPELAQAFEELQVDIRNIPLGAKLETFNDDEDTTINDVLKLIDRTIEIANPN